MSRRRWILTFLATASAGLLVWVLSEPLVAGELFGQQVAAQAAKLRLGSVLISFFGLLPLAMLVAAVAGYVSPRGFWLWGISVVCLQPVVAAFGYALVRRAGVVEPPSNYAGLAAIEAMTLLVQAVLCTAGSGVGAALRLLVGRITRRLGGASPDANYETRNDPGQ